MPPCTCFLPLGGLNTAFADGSVHYLGFDIDVVVFNALGTRNGEETVPNDTWN